MLKIGILIKKFDNLSNWELRIIDKLFVDPNYKIETYTRWKKFKKTLIQF